jgi:CRP/FNR family transcriptional regulator, cyclic AMP receptor protein
VRLQDTEFFRGLAVKEAVSLACCFVERSVAADEVMFSEGDRADALIVLLDGVFELTRTGTQGDVHLAYAEAGTLLGQVALLDPGPRTTTLRVLETGRYAVLDGGTFEKLWYSDGAAAARIQLKLAQVAVAELRNANRQLLELLSEPLETATSPDVQRVLGLVDSLWKAGIYR